MIDDGKTRAQLVAELAQLHERVAELERNTHSKLAEEELTRNRAVLRATIDCLPFNFFAIGPDGHYMLQNAISKEQHKADVIGKRPEEVCPNPHDLALWLDNNRRAFAGERVEGEVTLSLGGEERHYYNVVVPIRDGQQSYGILGVNIDITERKQAEAALRKAHDELEHRVQQRTAELTKANEELMIFRKFAEAAGQGFSMADLDGHLTYLNPAMCRILGLERPEEVVGQHLSVCYPEAINLRGKTEIEPILQRDGFWQGELPILSRQGTLIPTWHNSFLIRDERGNPSRMAVVITDITQRKKTEEALRQSRDELQVIYDGMMDGLVIVDFETTKAIRVNHATCKLLGYTEEEALKLPGHRIHPPEALPRVLEHFHATAKGHASRLEAMPFLRKDGEIIYLDVVGTRLSYNGRLSLIGFLHDVTDRCRAEAALRREQRTLEHMLRSSDHERQLIAYEIHDGLAQYLAGALMQFDVYCHLKNSKAKEALKAFEAGITMLRQSHSEARRLISGVRPPILDEAGIVAAISHLVNEQRRHAAWRIEFQSKVEFDRLVPILENAIYRIVQESLTNACRHAQSNRIIVELVQHDDSLRVAVRDWGIGFDPQKTEEGRFGLEGIRERARLLGGTARIDSRPGEGTSITVDLPVVLREEESY